MNWRWCLERGVCVPGNRSDSLCLRDCCLNGNWSAECRGECSRIVDGCVFPQKFPVSQRGASSSINLDQILVMWLGLQNCPRSVPSPGIWAPLVLQENFVTYSKRCQLGSVLGPGLPHCNNPFCQAFLPMIQQFVPASMWIILSWQYWQSISHFSAEDSHGW